MRMVSLFSLIVRCPFASPVSPLLMHHEAPIWNISTFDSASCLHLYEMTMRMEKSRNQANHELLRYRVVYIPPTDLHIRSSGTKQYWFLIGCLWSLSRHSSCPEDKWSQYRIPSGLCCSYTSPGSDSDDGNVWSFPLNSLNVNLWGPRPPAWSTWREYGFIV